MANVPRRNGSIRPVADVMTVDRTKTSTAKIMADFLAAITANTTMATTRPMGRRPNHTRRRRPTTTPASWFLKTTTPDSLEISSLVVDLVQTLNEV